MFALSIFSFGAQNRFIALHLAYFMQQKSFKSMKE
jgi:hypothetical protein